MGEPSNLPISQSPNLPVDNSIAESLNQHPPFSIFHNSQIRVNQSCVLVSDENLCRAFGHRIHRGNWMRRASKREQAVAHRPLFPFLGRHVRRAEVIVDNWLVTISGERTEPACLPARMNS